MSSTTKSPLRALIDILSSSVDALESAYAFKGASIQSLDELYTPNPELELDPHITETTNLIVGAAHQLIASVSLPMTTLASSFAMAMYNASALQYVVETSIADVLKEGDPKGLHVDEIAAKIKSKESDKTARVLRYLASRHCFREVTPNVFAHNRISSAMIKTKSLKEIQEDPLTQYDGLTLAAGVGHCTDEGLRSTVHMSHWLQHPESSSSPFSTAFQVDDMWQWYEQPGNELRRNRFATAMKAVGATSLPARIFTSALDWASYPENSIVVDVGGSTGSVTHLIAEKFPHLNYVIQDLPKIIENETPQYWQQHWPEFVAQGKVTFQAHDFFTPNPIKNASVFFMRTITHDWPKSKAVQILKQLRDAAQHDTKLILFEHIMPYACPDPDVSSEKGIKAPWPMLANLGQGLGGFLTSMDLHMMNMFGAQERTVAEFKELGDLSGWQLADVIPGHLGTVLYTVSF
jgi:hypothetical protein